MLVAIVDDNATNCLLLKGLVGKVGEFDTRVFRSAPEALEAFHQQPFDLAIFDYFMPEIDGVELIRRIRRIEAHRDTPVLVVTAFDELDIRLEALQAGATDFLSKPVNAVEFRARFANIAERRRAEIALRNRAEWLQQGIEDATRQLTEREEEIILRLSRAAEMRDNETGQHIFRVASSAREIAAELGCDRNFCRLLFLAAPMHDIGKVAVPDRVLLKPGPLTTIEREQMQVHARAGANILAGSASDLIGLAEKVALHHHERWDGRGYPDGLKGEDIPLAARIVAVADVFDALTSARVYKAAWPIEAAFKHIQAESGSHFDPRCVDAFVKRFPTIVRIREAAPDIVAASALAV